MRDPAPVVILSCQHVELKDESCATTDCPNFIDRPRIDPSWNYVLPAQYQG